MDGLPLIFLVYKVISISCRANIHQSNIKGTPIHIACQYSNLEIVKYLIDFGVNVNQANVYGATPIYIANLNGQLQIVQSLADHGADINKADKYGFGPLHIAIRYKYTDVAYCLIAMKPIQRCWSFTY